jgi:hypothetical protein
MYSQFYNRYPSGSLVSELLQIHEGHYVVRVVLQQGTAILSTGMAAASSIEQAEDQARLRALTALGVDVLEYESQAQLMEADVETVPKPRLNPAQPIVKSLDTAALTQAAPPEHWSVSPDTAVEPSPSDFDLFTQSYYQATDAGTNGLSAGKAKPTASSRTNGKPPVTTNSLEQPTNKSAAPAMATAVPDAPIDLSDIIAQSSVELKRLGWSESRGRSYLQRTYGKRSRQQLTDEELLDFLHYLQAEPSPGEPSF